MSYPSLSQLEHARFNYVQMHLRASDAGEAGSYSHVDVLATAIRECDDLIRDRRRANEVQAQADHARGKR